MNKTCVICGNVFNAKGTGNVCGENCSRERNRKQRVRHRAENPDKIREQNRRYRKKNPEKLREQLRLYRKKNPEKIREYSRHRAKNPENSRRWKRRWKRRKLTLSLLSLPGAIRETISQQQQPNQ